MKLSIAWIFDHIDADWQDQDINHIVGLFNKKVAEIEHWYPLELDLEMMALARVVSTAADSVQLEVPEWATLCQLGHRDDAHIGSWFVVIKKAGGFAWARCLDWGATQKDSLLPAVHVDPSWGANDWKKQVGVRDYIIEVDNKSITNRPDMWGHRGFAREIAALLGVSLKDVSFCVVQKKRMHAEVKGSIENFSVVNEDVNRCSRFALMHQRVVNRPSSIGMAARLARIDSKPIDALVDITNYVMNDIGHPMHIFDADQLQGTHLAIRRAHVGEKLALLDGQEIELDNRDVVIADANGAVSLAGIMGGAHSGVSLRSQSILVEAACFDAATIRLSSLAHKVRTDASARFEKSLDPNGADLALQRFAKLLIDEHIVHTPSEAMLVIGKAYEPVTITIDHALIQARLGVELTSDFVVSALTRIEFVVEKHESPKGLSYQIRVPSFRATKDVRLKEDIIEEVGRFYGYDAIKPVMPHMQLEAHDLSTQARIRSIKQYLAYGCQLRELCTYALYDEQFLPVLNWSPRDAVNIANPVSHHWRRMVTSLIPHLLKAVHENHETHDQLRFFEWGRIWNSKENSVVEQKTVAGVLYNRKSDIDFYHAKQLISDLYTQLSIPIYWQKIEEPEQPWYTPYQSAYIMVDGNRVGMAGKIDKPLVRNCFDGDAFIFELSADFLLSYQKPLTRFVPLAKYPDVVRDVSMLVAREVTADELCACVASVDARISAVDLVDFFSKPEWKEHKSLTIRYTIQDLEKTLTKHEADEVAAQVHEALTELGAEIR